MAEIFGLLMLGGSFIIVVAMFLIDWKLQKTIKTQNDIYKILSNIDKNLVISTNKQNETNKLLKEFLGSLSAE